MSKYQIFYKENHNIILSEDDTPQISDSEIRFLGNDNILVLKKGAHLKESEIIFHNSNSLIFIGEGVFTAKVSIFNNSVGYFGGKTYYSPTDCVLIKIAEHKNLFIGKNSVISPNVLVETNDSHLYFESIATEYVRKNYAKDIVLEDHIWIGRNVSINKGSYLSFNTVVASNSMVNKKFQESSVLLAGIPALVSKNSTFWFENNTDWYEENDTKELSTYRPNEEELTRIDYSPYVEALSEFVSNEKSEILAYKVTLLERLYEGKSQIVKTTDQDFKGNLIYTSYYDKKFEKDNYQVDLSKFSGKNIHQVAYERLDDGIVILYKHLLAHSYVFFEHQQNISYLVKRWRYIPVEIDKSDKNSLKKWGNLFYYMEYLEDKETSAKEKNLLVVFSSNPATDKQYDESMITRACYPTFGNIKRSLTKDTFIIRIVDLNLSSGSFYINTANFISFESDIQGLIKTFAQKHKVPEDNIVLFGASKGGTGALFHSLIGGYKMVAVDPIVDDSIYPNDAHFLKSFRTLDLIPRLNELLKTANQAKRYIINNHHVNYTYKQYVRIDDKENLIYYDTPDNVENRHPIILRSAIPEVLTMLNSLLNKRLSL